MDEIRLDEFGAVFHPISALLVYQNPNDDSDHKYYVEHFDIALDGRPLNAYPLSIQDAARLAQSLNIAQVKREKYLRPTGLLPANVLFVDTTCNGTVLWFTKAMKVPLYFTDDLGLENGIASIPPMLWKVKDQQLSVFALKSERRPNLGTRLYRAPFFNIHSNGSVCMGSVDTSINEQLCLEDFMEKWQEFFFNSRFSHLLGEDSPINGNCVQLWADLVGFGKPFPMEVLKTHHFKIDDLLKS